MDNKKGAYIYNDIDNEIILFMYLKTTKEQLKKILGSSFNDIGESNYLIANFKGGQNYMGCGSLENIKRFMNDTVMSNIIDNSYDENKKIFSNLTEEQFKSLTEFANKTLSSV